MPSPIEAPDGRTWVVQRRWVPRLGNETVWGRFHRRYRQVMRNADYLAHADFGCLEVIAEARAGDGTTLTWRTVGWRASGRRLVEIEQLLRAGLTLPPAEGTDPAPW